LGASSSVSVSVAVRLSASSGLGAATRCRLGASSRLGASGTLGALSTVLAASVAFTTAGVTSLSRAATASTSTTTSRARSLGRATTIGARALGRATTGSSACLSTRALGRSTVSVITAIAVIAASHGRGTLGGAATVVSIVSVVSIVVGVGVGVCVAVAGGGGGSTLHVVQINTQAALSGVAVVLLHVGLRPATEGREVGERGVVVIVSIPQGEAGSAIIGGPHDGLPLGRGGVDSERSTTGLGFTDHGLEEFLVLGLGVPVALLFDVEPQHAPLEGVLLDVVEGCVDLCSSRGRALGAGEHVDVNHGHATLVRIGDVLAAVGVYLTIAAVTANDSICVTLLNKTAHVAL
jgi:hypothetical protein